MASVGSVGTTTTSTEDCTTTVRKLLLVLQNKGPDTGAQPTNSTLPKTLRILQELARYVFAPTCHELEQLLISSLQET